MNIPSKRSILFQFPLLDGQSVFKAQHMRITWPSLGLAMLIMQPLDSLYPLICIIQYEIDSQYSGL